MTTSLPAKSSFFDLYTNAASLQFKPYSPTLHRAISSHPNLSGSITCLDIHSGFSRKGLFALHKHLLGFYENGAEEPPSAVLDISFCRLFSNAKIILIKGENSFELLFNEKQTEAKWLNALKGLCVLTNFHEKYSVLRTVGRGNFAKVYLIESRTSGKFYAAKAFPKEDPTGVEETEESRKLKLSIISEISLLRDVNYHNIANISKVYETDNSIYLILDHVQGRTLDQILSRDTFTQKYSDEEVASIFLSIMEGLAYLASKGIMHRDIKPANIIIEKEGKIKIVDFGFATYVDQPQHIFPTCGSPGFLALEILHGDPQGPPPRYDERCDIFSAGCILYHMLFGYALYPGTNNAQILELNQSASYLKQKREKIKAEIANKDSKINKQGLNLLLEMLTVDPKDRSTAIEILQNPYLRIVSQTIAISTSIKSHALDGVLNLNNDSELSGFSHSLYNGSPHLVPRDRIVRGNLAFYEQSRPEQFKGLDTMTTNMSSSPIVKHKIQDISPMSSIYLQRNIIDKTSSQLSLDLRGGPNRDRFSSFKAQPLEKIQTKIIEVNNDGETPLKMELKVEACFDFNPAIVSDEFNVEDDENCQVHFFIEQIKVQPQPAIRSKS